MVPLVLRLNKPLAQVALNSSSVSALYYQTTSDFCSFSFVFLFQGLFLKEDYVTGPLPFQEKQTRSFAGRMRPKEQRQPDRAARRWTRLSRFGAARRCGRAQGHGKVLHALAAPAQEQSHAGSPNETEITRQIIRKAAFLKRGYSTARAPSSSLFLLDLSGGSEQLKTSPFLSTNLSKLT